MAGRGRPPTPTAILKLRGSRWANRPNEPQPKVEAPRCPAHLTEAAKRIWKATVPDLHEIGMLARIDGATLARYCTQLARFWKAIKELEEQGETYTTDKGAIHKHPHVETVRGLDDSLRRIECEFGMTPASRTRIHVKATAKTPADDLSDFVKSKNRA